jgi:hypothetical protein
MKERENTIPDAGKIRLTKALERLVDLYTAWDKPGKAGKWQAELDKRLPEAEEGETTTGNSGSTLDKKTGGESAERETSVPEPPELDR